MKTILIGNIKGGCGKTTTAVNLAYILSRNNNKVLFIDADMQMNSTFTLDVKSGDGVYTLYDALMSNADLSLCIQHTKWDCLDIIAGDILMNEAVIKLMSDPEGMFAMQELVEKIAKTNLYDYVIIDTNPQANVLLRACMNASDEMIVPVFTDSYSAQGMSILSTEISAIQKRYNSNLHIAGILLCNVENRTKVAKDMMPEYNKIAEYLHTTLFKTYINKDVKVSESVTRHRLPVVAWKPNCTASMNYESLVEELEERGIL